MRELIPKSSFEPMTMFPVVCGGLSEPLLFLFLRRDPASPLLEEK
jgi:hypothetical protein